MDEGGDIRAMLLRCSVLGGRGAGVGQEAMAVDGGGEIRILMARSEDGEKYEDKEEERSKDTPMAKETCGSNHDWSRRAKWDCGSGMTMVSVSSHGSHVLMNRKVEKWLTLERRT